MIMDKIKRSRKKAKNSVLLVLTATALSPLLTCFLLTVRLLASYWMKGFKALPGRQPERKRESIYTMSDLMNEIERIPFGSHTPGTLGELLALVIDFVPSLLNMIPWTAGFFYPYPPFFEPVVFESRDGTPICGLVALQETESPKPALLIVHGLFSSKNSHSILTIALHAYYDWGFNVMVIDLRNFGDSARFSGAPTTWGYRESDDILAASAFLSSLEKVSTVGVLGISMGAASSIIAAGLSGWDGPISGGVVALHSYADSKIILDYLTARRPLTFKTTVIRAIFRLLILLNTLFHGPRPVFNLKSYTGNISSQYYEMTEDEILRKASPVKHISNIEIPCLVIHSRDDLVVPADQAEALRELGADNPMAGFIMNQTGGHAAYIYTNKMWLLDTLKIFFESWARRFDYNHTGQTGNMNVSGSLGNQNN